MKFTIPRSDLGKALAETEKDIERAVTSGMRDVANGLKQDLHEDVVAAGLGEQLWRTRRGDDFFAVESCGQVRLGGGGECG